jgi:hypothetical protein
MARLVIHCAFLLSFTACMGCSSTRTQSASQVVAEQMAPVVEQSKRLVESSDSFFAVPGASR